MNKLRQALWDLDNDPRVNTTEHDVVASVRIDPTGRLAGFPDYLLFEKEVGPVIGVLPGAIRRAVDELYGDSLDERDLNLIATGAELVTLALQQWTRLMSDDDSVPG